MKQYLSLNGQWRYMPELEVRPENNNNLTEGYVFADPALCRNDWAWGEVPGVWNHYAEVFRLWEGVMWFCREIHVPDFRAGQRARLHFEGVSYRADVFVNGTPVGTHESSYTEFSLDVTAHLKTGKNLIAVRVENRALTRKWPCDRGYFCYGGIYRDVTLELSSPGDLSQTELTPGYDPETGEGILRVTGCILGGRTDCVSVSVGTQTASVAPQADGSFDAVLRIPGVMPWSPEDPQLYPVRLSTDEDVETASIGFRRFESKDGRLCLNGQAYHLNGVCYVYDSPKYGLTMTHDQLQDDLQEMKAAGVNAIRLHYAMNQEFYRLCDSMGFLVWVEPSVYCYHPSLDTTNTFFQQPDYVENARQIIREMIAGARSHCCVAFYGIGNECYVDHPEAGPFFRSLSELVRSLDSTRLVSFAALYGLVDRIGDVIDVIGLNSYYGWYDRISDLYTHQPQPEQDGRVPVNHPDLTPFHRMVRKVMEQIPATMPILLTEFGADSIPGNHSSCKDLWSEEYHAEVILETIRASKQYDRILGTFPFCFTDYYDPSKPMNGYWKDQNLKGMLTHLRDRKCSFYALQAAYGGHDEL